MSIQPSIRPTAAKGESAPTAAGDATPAGDMFTLIVTGLDEGHTGGPDVPGGTVPAPKAGEAKITSQPGESDPNQDVNASVEQLLALVAGGRTAPSPRQGKTKDEGGKEKLLAKAKTEIAVGRTVTPTVAAIAPAIPVATAPAALFPSAPAAVQSPSIAATPAPPLSPPAQALLADIVTETAAPVASPSVQTAAVPFATPIPAAVSASLMPQAPSMLSVLAGTAAVAPQAIPAPAAAASVAIPIPAVVAGPDAQTAESAAASPQKPSAPSGAASVIGPATLVDPKSDAAAATEPAAPMSPGANAIPAATASPAPQPVSQAAPAALQALSAAFAGKEATKPTSIDRSRAASTPSPVAPLATAAPRIADAQVLASNAPAPATDMRPADAATAAPLQGLVMERQLDLAHQQDWIDQVARDIAGMAGGEGKTLNFRLNPEHLGNLQVEISQSHQGAAVRFSTDSEAARTLIADAKPRLVAEARAQGVRIAEAHVDLSGSGSGDPRRQPAAAPDTVPIRTARSLQEDRTDDGKPSPNRRDLYA